MKKSTLLLLCLVLMTASSIFGATISPCNPELTRDGTTVYWCCTDFGRSWTRIELAGMNVVSLRSFDTVVLQEKREQLEQARAELKITAEVKPEKSAPPVYSARIGDCYHTRLDCPAGKRIKEENKLFFLSEKMAAQAGRHCCMACKAIKKEINRSVKLPQGQDGQHAKQGRHQPNN